MFLPEKHFFYIIFEGDNMKWNDKRYNSLNFELKKVFGEKVAKLSLNGGFTCPNRDGTIGSRGCLFCSDEGSGEFAGPKELSITEQIDQQKEMLSRKWKTKKFIAYFQNYTNTYSDIDDLRNKYEEAYKSEGVVGLAIATRPDCLSDDVIDLLDKINKETFLWVELGLQTIHEKTAKLIRRGYNLDTFNNAVEKLRSKNIRIVVHLIIGLPNETKEEIIETAKYISKLKPYGAKLHLLHILSDSDLYSYYKRNPFKILTEEEYTEIICDILEVLDSSIVIHRLTGDGHKDKLITPKWSLNKLKVLSGIDKELKRRDSYQGKKYK